MGLLIIYAAASVFFSFLCSILEAVLLSVTPTFLKVKEQEGAKFVEGLRALKTDVDKPLIAILTINTLAHTVGAILVGVQAENMVRGSEYSASYFGIPFVGIVSGVMTALILVLSEIIPKTIGATYWQSLAGLSTTGLQIMVACLKYTGILWLLQLTTKVIGSNGHIHMMTREEFIAIADTAQEEGIFNPAEGQYIKSLMNFNQIRVKDIMTPRSVMVMAQQNKTIRGFFDEHEELRFSRIPLYGKTRDEVTGYVLKDEILEHIIEELPTTKLSDLRRDINHVPETMPIPELFNTMVATREHIALVVDDYGNVQGIATMEDVIETMLGLEIMDESDDVVDMQQLARKNWEKRSRTLGLKQNKKDNDDPLNTSL